MRCLCPVCHNVSIMTAAGTFYCYVCDRWFPFWTLGVRDKISKKRFGIFPYAHKITITFKPKREYLPHFWEVE